MTTIYVGRSAAGIPDAASQLEHLAGAGHKLVLVEGEPTNGAGPDHGSDAPADGGRWTARVPSPPPTPERGSWFITADPADCGDRVPGLRTVLIGPREEGPRPTRCDSTARDLRDAVLEVLTADAMP
jgi:hypothetical protein